MNRRTNEQWQMLFKAHEKSGLSAAAFCKKHSLNPKYFSLRRKQLQPVSSQQDSTPFVRAESLSLEWVAALLKQLS